MQEMTMDNMLIVFRLLIFSFILASSIAAFFFTKKEKVGHEGRLGKGKKQRKREQGYARKESTGRPKDQEKRERLRNARTRLLCY